MSAQIIIVQAIGLLMNREMMVHFFLSKSSLSFSNQSKEICP